MRINIKKFNSKTYVQRENWGKGPSKKKQKQPLFKRDTFHTVKEEMVQTESLKLFGWEKYIGYVQIDPKKIKPAIEQGFSTEESEEILLLHSELGTIFSVEIDNTLIFSSFRSSSEFNIATIKTKTGETHSIPLSFLKTIEPTDEEVYVELMNRELNK